MSLAALLVAQVFDPLRALLAAVVALTAHYSRAKWLILPVGVLIISVALPSLVYGLAGAAETASVIAGLFSTSLLAGIVLALASAITRRR